MTILLTTKEAWGQVKRLIVMNVRIKGTTRGNFPAKEPKKVPCRAESSHALSAIFGLSELKRSIGNGNASDALVTILWDCTLKKI
ncbi:hypothetical protein Tco_0128457 [Tanacetum coccineum]